VEFSPFVTVTVESNFSVDLVVSKIFVFVSVEAWLIYRDKRHEVMDHLAQLVRSELCVHVFYLCVITGSV